MREALHAVLGIDLTQIHGLGPYLALKLVGECGTDLSAWPSAKHFTSWLGLAPHNKIAKEHPDLKGSPKLIAPLPAGALVQETDPKRKNWYRLTLANPVPAEQVALTLLKDQKEAYRIEVAHPLYGVKQWGDENIIQNLADDKQDGFIEEIALNQANAIGVKSTSTTLPADVIAQIRTNALTIRTSVHEAASALGYDGLAAYSTKLSERANRLEKGANDTETKKWEIQSRAQFAIIVQGARGLEADRKRQNTYAAQFGGKKPSKDAIPEQQRQALFDDAKMWAGAIEASDAVKTAEAMLQAAFQHSATLEMDVLEQQLSMPQAAADLPNQDKDSQVNKDMNPASLGPREVDLRKRIGLLRQQTLTDPSKIDTTADKIPEETRKLVFESNVVMQAEQMDQQWRILDDVSGFWAWVTGDSATINGLKTQGKGYYTQWKAVYADVKANKIDDAQKKYEALVGDRAFQKFLGTVQDAVKTAQAKQMIAKLITMVVITIVSMGVGTIVEGLVGGGAAIAGAAEGTAAVSAGLGASRTAAAVAGFIAETGTFTLASNLLLSKDHSAKAMLTDFAKNIAIFGAMRGIGKLLEVAGVGKIIKAAAKPGASTGAVVAGGAAKVATDVAMGGAGVLAGIIEAKIHAAIAGQNLSDAQLKEIIHQNVAQAIIMVIVGRVLQSPLRTLKIAAAQKGSKWRAAELQSKQLEALSKPYNVENPHITETQLRDLIVKDMEQIQAEKAAFEEVRAQLVKEGKSTTSIDEHLAQLDKHGDASASSLLLVGLKPQSPNHFLSPVTDIPVLKAQHEKLGSKWEELPPKQGEPRTYQVTNAAGEKFFITEDVPGWALTPSGQRFMTAAKTAGIDEALILGMTEAERMSILKLERALEANDPHEIAKAKQELGKLTKTQQDAFEKALATSKSKSDQKGKIIDPKEQSKLAEIRKVDPTGKVRSASELTDADVALSMNAQMDKVKPSELDAIVGKYPVDQQAKVRTVLAKSSGFGNMESMNDLWTKLEPHLKAGRQLYTPGRGSLADNVMYMHGKGAFSKLPTGGTPLVTTKSLGPNTVVILDGVVLAEIKAEPAKAQSLVNQPAGGPRPQLLQPRGFETGNNMFNSPTPESIAQRTQTILDKANTISKSESIPFDKAVERVLDERATQALHDAGVDTKLAAGQLEVVDPAANVDVSSSAAIAARLNDNAGITAQQVTDALAKYSEADRALLREMIAHQAEIFSTRRQTQELSNQADQMYDIAAQKGKARGDVYYFIYKDNKSYGMLAMAHREITGTEPSHYINGPKELKALKLADSKMLVILDDVAGSGQSLSSAFTQAREAGFNGEIVISPMVSTKQAPTTVHDGFGTKGSNPDMYGQAADAKTTFAPKSYANTLHDSAWFKSLNATQQARLDYLIQDAGYGDNGLCMAFPYMSPDNNNVMFAGTMAEHFIANQNGAAAKNKNHYTGNNK